MSARGMTSANKGFVPFDPYEISFVLALSLIHI